jgi:hypothetical protein
MKIWALLNPDMNYQIHPHPPGPSPWGKIYFLAAFFCGRGWDGGQFLPAYSNAEIFLLRLCFDPNGES